MPGRARMVTGLVKALVNRCLARMEEVEYRQRLRILCAMCCCFSAGEWPAAQIVIERLGCTLCQRLSSIAKGGEEGHSHKPR